jgi:nucleoid-associated protein YgaU
MGLFDKLTGGDQPKKKADFSDVQSGGSSTAPASTGGTQPYPPQAPQHPAAARTYTVVAGDSLSKIAKREYGDAKKWPAIFEANRDKIKDPDLIHPGQVLTLPNLT